MDDEQKNRFWETLLSIVPSYPTPDPALAPAVDPAIAPVVAPAVVTMESRARISDHEKQVILWIATQLYTPPANYWTPRAIRHLEMQYCLARTILVKIGMPMDQKTIKSLIAGILEGLEFQPKFLDGKKLLRKEDELLEEVIQMVLWRPEVEDGTPKGNAPSSP